MAQVVLYFDFISPYSYVAFKLLQRLSKPWNLNVTYRPVSLPTIIKLTGNSPPASVPARGKFLVKDLTRTASLYNIPFKPVQNFLTVPLKSANLVITALGEMLTDDVEGGGGGGGGGTTITTTLLSSQHITQVIDEIWLEFFGRGKIELFNENPESLKPILERVLSERLVKEVIRRASSEEVAAKFRSTTNEAINNGAFGAPTMLVTKNGKTEFFFGSDRFHHMANFLGVNPGDLFCRTATTATMASSKL